MSLVWLHYNRTINDITSRNAFSTWCKEQCLSRKKSTSFLFLSSAVMYASFLPCCAYLISSFSERRLYSPGWGYVWWQVRWCWLLFSEVCSAKGTWITWCILLSYDVLISAGIITDTQKPFWFSHWRDWFISSSCWKSLIFEVCCKMAAVIAGFCYFFYLVLHPSISCLL